MRPYQLEPNGEWVDLDTIQSIDPPKFIAMRLDSVYGFIQFSWRHAFQNEPRYYRRGNGAIIGGQFELEINGGLPEAGLILEDVRRTVYEPFLAAWQTI